MECMGLDKLSECVGAVVMDGLNRKHGGVERCGRHKCGPKSAQGERSSDLARTCEFGLR